MRLFLVFKKTEITGKPYKKAIILPLSCVFLIVKGRSEKTSDTCLKQGTCIFVLFWKEYF